jgi:hypothetical protein
MNNSYIWISYLVTYGLIVGYVVVVWSRIRSHRGRSSDTRT